jgi:hypothetical protein
MHPHARATAKLRKQDPVSVRPERRFCVLTENPIYAVGLLRGRAPVLRLQASVSAESSPIRELLSGTLLRNFNLLPVLHDLPKCFE